MTRTVSALIIFTGLIAGVPVLALCLRRGWSVAASSAAASVVCNLVLWGLIARVYLLGGLR